MQPNDFPGRAQPDCRVSVRSMNFVALDSADTWQNRAVFRLDVHGMPLAAAGVPPDYFSELGQLWGNPLYDWDYLAQTGYAWWIDRLRAAFELYDVIRLDHFRGFD